MNTIQFVLKSGRPDADPLERCSVIESGSIDQDQAPSGQRLARESEKLRWVIIIQPRRAKHRTTVIGPGPVQAQ